MIRLAWPGGRKKVKSAVTRFKDGGADDLRTINNLIRGALIARLDEMYTTGRFGELLGRDHPDPDVQERAMDLFQTIMVELFPSEFAAPGDGIVATAGPRRVGADRLKVWAKLNGIES